VLFLTLVMGLSDLDIGIHVCVTVRFVFLYKLLYRC